MLDPADYQATVDKIVAAYRGLKDPATGKPVVEKVLTKAQLADVEGSDSLNPTRSGDVVVVTKVPYEFDGNTVGTLVAPSKFFGQHGYLPDDVDLAHNINMHATFVAGGPGHRARPVRSRACARSTSRRRWPCWAASTRRCRRRAAVLTSILKRRFAGTRPASCWRSTTCTAT